MTWTAALNSAIAAGYALAAIAALINASKREEP